MACKPEMDSLITVFNPDGTINYPIEQDGTLVWKWIVPESIVKYRVKTFPEGGEVGMSDEFSFAVIRQDYTYIKQLSDRVYEEATTEQKKQYDDEIIDYLNKRINDLPLFNEACANEIDMERIMANVYSTVKMTDENGEYEGTYKIPKSSTYGQYAFVISYGYDEKARQQTDAKAMSYWDMLLIAATAVSLAVLAILIIWYAFAAVIYLATAGAGLVGVGGGAVSIGSIGAGGGVGAVVVSAFSLGAVSAAAVYTAEFIFLWWLDDQLGATEQFMLAVRGYTRNPSVGENKYGCVFKDEEGNISSIVHTYGSVIAPDIQFNEEGGVDEEDMTFDWKNRNVLVGAGLLIFSIVALKKSGG
mgnify:CR=1 FL=1|tara:strand:- start:1192 stop:2268 length:1077 start_codon:yes stop_codon:yes gene_type:complete